MTPPSDFTATSYFTSVSQVILFARCKSASHLCSLAQWLAKPHRPPHPPTHVTTLPTSHITHLMRGLGAMQTLRSREPLHPSLPLSPSSQHNFASLRFAARLIRPRRPVSYATNSTYSLAAAQVLEPTAAGHQKRWFTSRAARSYSLSPPLSQDLIEDRNPGGGSPSLSGAVRRFASPLLKTLSIRQCLAPSNTATPRLQCAHSLSLSLTA